MHGSRWALPVLGGLLLAACGSTSTTSGAGASPSGGGSPSSSGASTSSSPAASLPGGSFCGPARDFALALTAEALQFAQGAAAAQSNPQRLGQEITDLVTREVALIRQMVQVAPADVKGDVDYIAAALATAAQAAASSNGDLSKLFQTLEPFNRDPKVAAAVQHLQSVLATQCAFTPQAAPSGVPSIGQP